MPRRAAASGPHGKEPLKPPDSQPLSTTATTILADDRDGRRARTIRRLAAVELVDRHYGRVPPARWCRWCRGECRVLAS